MLNMQFLGYPAEYQLIGPESRDQFYHLGWRLICLDSHPEYEGEHGIMEMWDADPTEEQIADAMRDELISRKFRKNWAHYDDSDTFVYGAIWIPPAILELVNLVIDEGLTKEQAHELFEDVSNNALVADAGNYFVELGHTTAVWREGDN